MSYFNPRSPCGERPTAVLRVHNLYRYFNPRSPCGERRWAWRSISCKIGFQSALPLRGATWLVSKDAAPFQLFQSALPLRGATQFSVFEIVKPLFQSALPLRGATKGCPAHSAHHGFQSALPLRGATATFCSITLLSAKYCSFKDRRRKFIRQIPQNSSKIRYNVVRTSLVGYERLWFATS